MSDFSALVAEFIGITACDASCAAACLRAHNNNLERAVTAYLDGWRGPTAAATAVPECDGDAPLRAPIAPRCEQLLTEGDLGLGSVPAPRRAPVLSGRAHTGPQRCIFDAFRNFRQEGAEGDHREKNSDDDDDDDDENGNSSDSNDEGEGVYSASKQHFPPSVTSLCMFCVFPTTERGTREKVSRLAQQFRRPTDIAVDADFEGACACAADAGLLLVANVQDVAEFASHVLNRDVWADARVRAALRGQYVLWQCGSDCADAQRFVRLYRVARLPHICVLDPLTGEVLRAIDVPITACVADANAVAQQCLFFPLCHSVCTSLFVVSLWRFPYVCSARRRAGTPRTLGRYVHRPGTCTVCCVPGGRV